MTRKASSTEERARDALAAFLQTDQGQPIQTFMEVVFGNAIPHQLCSSSLTVEIEVMVILKSRTDLLIVGDDTVLCLEIKVDAGEQPGQYLKYRDALRRKYKHVYLSGLVNQFKNRGVGKDHEPFLEFLGVRRFLWSELLAAFKVKYGDLASFRAFKSQLTKIDPTIGTYARETRERSAPQKKTDLLATDTGVLLEFYKDLANSLPDFETAPNKYGNAPYELQIGKLAWAGLFQEHCCRRVFLGLNAPNSQLAEAHFVFCIVLWNRSWFLNESWFLANRKRIAEHFVEHGFQMVRNDGLTWHRTVAWPAHYESVRGLKFANAFWEHRFRLGEREYTRLGWEKALAKIQTEFRVLERVVDELGNILRKNAN